jgi:WD40 repeat protein
MHESRASHSATLLPSGKVLIAGGFKKGPDGHSQIYFHSTELYDPGTRVFSPTGNLNFARCGHTATLLTDGKVLITGGNNDDILSSAELYDPSTGTFALLGDMAVGREGHTATLLGDGTVLIAGGSTNGQASAELFRQSTRRFEPTGNLSMYRGGQTATLLVDGRVLLTGGSGKGHETLATTDLYDPGTRTFTPSGTMNVVRRKHAAVRLSSGNVLVVGGSDNRDWSGKYRSAEIYDVSTGTFTGVSDMGSERFKLPRAIALLRNGEVLVCGGSTEVEIYDPIRMHFRSVSQFENPHYFSTATVLPDGCVLILGGYDNTLRSTEKAWLFAM